MFVTYVVVTLLTAAANAFSATLDFVRYERVLTVMSNAGVSHRWLNTLGLLKAAGAIGLLVGLLVPPVGTAAAAGLVLFFVAAVVVHLRVGDYSMGLAIVFLSLAIVALALRLAVT